VLLLEIQGSHTRFQGTSSLEKLRVIVCRKGFDEFLGKAAMLDVPGLLRRQIAIDVCDAGFGEI